jgi:hypothetical protein
VTHYLNVGKVDSAVGLRHNAGMQTLLRPNVSRLLGIAFETSSVLGEGFAVLKSPRPLLAPDSTAVLRELPVNTRLKIENVSMVDGVPLYRVRVLRGKGISPGTWAYDGGHNTRGNMNLAAADLRH